MEASKVNCHRLEMRHAHLRIDRPTVSILPGSGCCDSCLALNTLRCLGRRLVRSDLHSPKKILHSTRASERSTTAPLALIISQDPFLLDLQGIADRYPRSHASPFSMRRLPRLVDPSLQGQPCEDGSLQQRTCTTSAATVFDTYPACPSLVSRARTPRNSSPMRLLLVRSFRFLAYYRPQWARL